MTENEHWKDYRRLFAGEIQQIGDVRSSKFDYTYRESIPESYIGKPVVPDSETDFFYFRTNSSDSATPLP